MSALKLSKNSFDEYLHKVSLHPDLQNLFATAFPSKLGDLRNLIFYGPKGVGKYTQMLVALSRYSPSVLKYEKKVIVTLNKHSCVLRLSDVHFEVDMALLGCQAKLMWHEIYNQIVDIVLARAEHTGVIVCKSFQDIHPELLETLYSYMQTCPTNQVRLTLILLTDELSFIPDNIFNCCQLLTLPRPSRALYNACLLPEPSTAATLPMTSVPMTSVPMTSVPMTSVPMSLADISNIKNLHLNVPELMRPHEVICQKLLDDIKNPQALNFLILRENLYDLFIYNLNLFDCVWYIIDHLTRAHLLPSASQAEVWLKTYTFLQYFNNNYRPVYHVESFILFLIEKVHGYRPLAI
jgi:hypothetical protein